MLARKEPVYNHIKIAQKYLFECHEERLFVFSFSWYWNFWARRSTKKRTIFTNSTLAPFRKKPYT